MRTAPQGRRRGPRRVFLTPPPPVDPEDPLTLAELMAPSPAMLAEAMDTTLSRMRWAIEPALISNDTGGSQNNRADTGHCLVVIALAAWAGVTTVIGGMTPAAKLLDQLIWWTDDGQDRMPVCDGGYKAQYEIMFAATVAIAKLTPAVWSHASLTSTRKARLDLAMQALLISSAWCVSDDNPFIGNFANERTIWGFMSGRQNAVNFSTPPKLIPLICARYLGVSAAQSFMASFDRPTFYAALTAAGSLGKAALTFSQNWTPALVDAAYGIAGGSQTGPTRAQLETAVRGYTYNGWGLGDAAAAAVMASEIERNFGRPIRPGVVGWPGGAPYGTQGTHTNGQLRAVLTDPSAWAGLPNSGATTGCPQELDTTDGGGGGRPNVRSAMSYVARGMVAGLAGWAALAAQGAHIGQEEALAEGVARLRRAVVHVRYVTRWGWRSYAKGGWNGSSWPANNEDWNAAWAAGRSGGGMRLACRWGLGDALLSGLTGARVDTAAMIS